LHNVPFATGATADLGHLAWVLEDVRKSLYHVTNAVRGFELDIKKGVRFSGRNNTDMQAASRHAHQSAGALEMVGHHTPAKLVRAMGQWIQIVIQRPDTFVEDAATVFETAYRALIDYFEGLLKGSSSTPVALFVQYRSILHLSGVERIHPADLWPGVGGWENFRVICQTADVHQRPVTRRQLDEALLPVLKNCDSVHAQRMRDLCCGLAYLAITEPAQTFWWIAAAFFEALGLGKLPSDVYVRRTAARIIPAYGLVGQGQSAAIADLAHELLFYCAFAKPSGVRGQDALLLQEVRKVFGLEQSAPIDYESAPFGKFDPVLLAQLRKNIALAAEGWSALSGGDIGRSPAVVAQFADMSSSVMKLHPHSEALISALTAAVEITARRAKSPSTAIAIEVATAILYLEVAYDDLDLANHTIEQRSARLAVRLHHVVAGGEPLPIERWMEALYRRVGERKAIGSVVAELALALTEIERSLDAFVRNPSEHRLLDAVPVALGQMRGVFSVLGLDQAALASLRMRSTIEHLLSPEISTPEHAKKWTLQLVNSLSALGFLIDMLRYQPSMVKDMFEFDEVLGEFRLTMERETVRQPVDGVAQFQMLSGDVSVSPSMHTDVDVPTDAKIEISTPDISPDLIEVSHATEEDVDDAEIQTIFLAEACEVVNEGKASIIALSLASANSIALGSLRRAFHTLKGSARMVGFQDFGEVAWAFEQLLNAWLETNRPTSEIFLTLCEDALGAMALWIETVSQGQSPPFQAMDFRLCADALRLENRYVPLPLYRRLEATSAQPQESNLANVMPSEPQASAEFARMAATTPVESSLTSKPSGVSLYHGAAQGLDESTGTAVNFITIGRLHLRLDFFEVFVNEGGLWASQLQSEIENWQATTSQEAVQRAGAMAHALQGSAAAVGFTALATLAQAMERSIEYLGLHSWPITEAKTVLVGAAKEVQRLMDAFASGMLAKPNLATLEGLTEMLDSGASKSPDAEVPGLTMHQAAELAKSLQPEIVSSVPVIAEPAAISGIGRLHVESESQDVLDSDLWPIFFEEGLDLLQGLSKSLRVWAIQPQELELRAQSLRILHTLKGSARLAGAMRLGEIAHQMESAIERVAENSLPNDADVAPLLRYLDQIESVFGELAHQRQLDTLEDQVKTPQDMSVGTPSERNGFMPPLSVPAIAPVRTITAATLRVRVQVLDRLIDQAGEVMTGRARMEQRLVHLHNSTAELGRNVERIRSQLRDLEIQTELQMKSRQSLSAEAATLFDPLELDRFTALQEVSRMMAESVADADTLHKGLQSDVEGAQEDLLSQGRRAKELTNSLLRMRLVEFESISDRLYGVVRQAAKETGKQVRLDIEGGSIEIDRGVLDRMTPSFEHMLRNAVVHGIEPSNVRVASGKSAAGAISISVHQDGSDVSVRFADDGAGLQLEKIHARAMAAQLVEGDQPLTYEQAAKLLFIPGFSTADQVTELAGRGIGMDVVLSDISAIGGRIETSSQPAGGTVFQLVFPLTTAITQIVMLRMDTVTIGVPANLLETVQRIPTQEVEEAYASGILRQPSGQGIPFFWAGAILGSSVLGVSRTPSARQQSVAVIRSAGQRVALHVDEVLGNREVVVKNLGTQLSQLPGLVGISVLASGAVVLIYNPVALMNVFGEATRREEVAALSLRAALDSGLNARSSNGGSSPRTSPLVLVVDDSITVRRVTQRLLSRAGFRVALASDGIQALELLRDERPALVLSDIEMPRMDGMELTRQIRADIKLSDLPIIIITSRTAQKHRDHAVALGANHYLGKPYAEAELLDLVGTHCVMAEFA